MAATLYPSLMSADLLNLEREINTLNPHVTGYHIDIMDNHFVPNITFGFDTVHGIARITSKQLWIHAMVDNPTSMIDQLHLPANTIYSFHIESNFMKKNIIKKLTGKNWLPSIAIKPKTDVTQLFDLLDASIYQVLVMSVEPGFAGQSFMPDSLAKIDALVAFRAQHNLNFMIGIDGGIKPTNIAQTVQHGAQQIAAASGIFSNPDRVAALNDLKNA